MCGGEKRIVHGATAVLVVLGLLVSTGRTFAAEAEWRQSINSRILPQYCQDRLDPERWKKWRDYFGPAYIHMHHYCSGLYAEIKAKATIDRKKRNEWLAQVVGEMTYVSRACDPACVIYADLHRRWAWALSAQGHSAEAAKHLELMKAARPRAGPTPAVPN